ncbi:MAG: gamma-glutamyl-gamma-aminobutyrate hydrolase family protein [Chloroflexi bacterium]|nr:gamma-glutamyl-gamma-aminobutyrate hydrolase family protein [Chloroflexota bacterium]
MSAGPALIAVTATSEREARPYVDALTARGGAARVLTAKHFAGVSEAVSGVSGLLLCGGCDIDPARYGAEAEPATGKTEPARDEMELAVLRDALERNMPVLAICRGMQLVNVAFGGTLLQDIPGHVERGGPNDGSVRHEVYVAPGSKLGAIMGAGAVYKTNSLHHQGLREAQRAPELMASAFHPHDGIVEALESPAHPWLMAVQCHPEREDEVPKSFRKLFDWLAGWSGRFGAGDMP